MYTTQENVRIVLSLLKQYNIKYIVVSPGGTNIPITQAVQDDPFFQCYSVPDERSAMYFAIGLYLQTGEIIATSCTSAQATRNYIPGLTEAFYKHVPILAITTSKLERFQYKDYMQAPDQCSLPRDSVKKSFDLPPVTDENSRRQCINSATEAIMETLHRKPGPVQLNIRINDSLQSRFEEIALPKTRAVFRHMAWDDWGDIDLQIENKKILIVVGEHRPFSKRLCNAIDNFCNSYNVVVYVNNLSNYHGDYALQANLLISCGGLMSLAPDVLITIGGQTGDYSIFYAIKGINNVEHWYVSEDGHYMDTYDKLTRIFECPDYFFFERLAGNAQCEHDYFQSWKQLNDSVNYEVDLPFSNLYIAQQLYRHIPQKSVMNFAILNSLRCWNYFPLDRSIQGYANVAAFGIDGCTSMLIGESMYSDRLYFLVTGDLAFFYDMNVIGIRHIRNNIRILLVNNGGGVEFKVMTQSWKDKVNVNEFISAKGHNSTAEGWARSCGFKYLSVRNKQEFDKVKDIFIAQSDSPIILEAFTKDYDEVMAIELMKHANEMASEKGDMKYVIKKVVGDKGISIIKKILKNN